MARRLRAEAVDRRRRSKDQRACEESGALRARHSTNITVFLLDLPHSRTTLALAFARSGFKVKNRKMLEEKGYTTGKNIQLK